LERKTLEVGQITKLEEGKKMSRKEVSKKTETQSKTERKVTSKFIER
jgi:hypothetical protein